MKGLLTLNAPANDNCIESAWDFFYDKDVYFNDKDYFDMMVRKEVAA